MKLGISRVEQLVTYTAEELFKFKGVGKFIENDIIKCLAYHNLKLKEDDLK